MVEGEVESVRRAPGLIWTVRHHVVGGVWHVRGLLSADEPMTVGGATLSAEPGNGAAWVWAAGSVGLVVLADAMAQPVLLRLRRGRLLPDDGHGRDIAWLEPGATVGRHVVVELTGTRPGSWSAIADALPAWLPPLALPEGDELQVTLPDDSVTSPDAATQATDGSTVRVTGAGHVHVRVEGVSGDIALAVDFAPTLDSVVRRAAHRIVTATEQGSVADLPTDLLAARVLVLDASGTTQGDAYDLLLGELVERPDADPLRTVALVRAAVASPERWVVDGLDRALGSVSGVEARTVVKAVLRAALWSPELSDLTRRRLPPMLDLPERSALLAARLGGGLPGCPGDGDRVALARTAALLAAGDEPLDPADWPASAAVMVEHTTRRLLTTASHDDRVLGWLLVGLSAGGQD